MRERGRRPETLVLVALASLLLSGCATGKPPLKPAQLGTVGIVSVTWVKTERGGGRPIPGASAGAARGARVYGSAMVTTALKDGWGQAGVSGLVAALGLIVLAPVGAVVGAVIGAVGAESAEDVARADSTLEATFARLDPAHAVRTHLLEVLQKHSLRTVVMVDQERVAGLSDFAPLGEDGIDTILELYAITISLTGPDFPERRIHPAHKFRMEIKTRLLRPDGTSVHEETFDVTRKRSFVDWAAHDARALRAATNRAVRELAEDIVTRYLRKPVLVEPGLSDLHSPRPSAPPPPPIGPSFENLTQLRMDSRLWADPR